MLWLSTHLKRICACQGCAWSLLHFESMSKTDLLWTFLEIFRINQNYNLKNPTVPKRFIAKFRSKQSLDGTIFWKCSRVWTNSKKLPTRKGTSPPWHGNLLTIRAQVASGPNRYGLKSYLHLYRLHKIFYCVMPYYIFVRQFLFRRWKGFGVRVVGSYKVRKSFYKKVRKLFLPPSSPAQCKLINIRV